MTLATVPLPSQRRRRLLSTDLRLVLLAGALVSYGALACLLFINAPLARFPDTQTYIAVARRPLLSAAFWATSKPPTYPLTLRLLHENGQAVAVAQLVLAVLSWTLLGLVVAATVRHSKLKVLAVAVLLASSLGDSVFLWNKVLLTESISTSLFVLLVALWLILLRRLGQRQRRLWSELLLGIGVVFVAACWSFSRDSNAYGVAMAGGLIVALLALSSGIVALQRWRGSAPTTAVPPRGLPLRQGLLLLLIAASYGGIFLVQQATITRSRRWEGTFLNVLTHRILVSPQRTAFFTARGMPLDPALVQKAGTLNEISPDQTGSAFRTWLDRRGQGVYDAYLLQQPLARMSEVGQHLETVLDSDTTFYSGMDSNSSLVVTEEIIGGFSYGRGYIFWLLTLACLGIGLLLIGLRVAARPLLIPLVLLALVLPLAFVTYHGDAAEIERHGVGVAQMLRLGLWLTVLFGIDALTARYGHLWAPGSRFHAWLMLERPAQGDEAEIP